MHSRAHDEQMYCMLPRLGRITGLKAYLAKALLVAIMGPLWSKCADIIIYLHFAYICLSLVRCAFSLGVATWRKGSGPRPGNPIITLAFCCRFQPLKSFDAFLCICNHFADRNRNQGF
jgi:hypothetical protein